MKLLVGLLENYTICDFELGLGTYLEIPESATASNAVRGGNLLI